MPYGHQATPEFFCNVMTLQDIRCSRKTAAGFKTLRKCEEARLDRHFPLRMFAAHDRGLFIALQHHGAVFDLADDIVQCLGVASMALVDAVDAAVQQLLDHPAVGAGISLVQGDAAGFHEKRGRTMATAGRTAVHQTAHEFSQLGEVQRAMLELDIDRVVQMRAIVTP